MKKLIEGLRHFQQNIHWQRQELFDRSTSGQKPQALLVTCSDSRVLPDQLMQADPGDLFVHRNAGNLIPNPETPSGEAATIEYALTNLGVSDIVVCGHYRCGAIKALLDADLQPQESPIGAWLKHASETLTVMEKDHSQLVGQERWDKAVEQNVLVQLRSLTNHPTVAAGLAAGKLRLHAWVLRFESSEVMAFDPITESFTPLLEMPEVHAAIPASREISKPSATWISTSAVANSSPVTTTWIASLQRDVAASLTVFMIALPLCLAIARACGVPPELGVITGVVGGLVVGLLSGSPLQVSGPTASQIAVVVGVAQTQGLAALGVAVSLAGVLQVVAGVLRLGQWFRAVSPAVILGMLAGIGVALFAQQFHLAVDDPPTDSPLMNLAGIPRAAVGAFSGHYGHAGHVPAAITGLLTLGILLSWQKMAPNGLRAVPAVLIAVVVSTVTAALLRLPVQFVQFGNVLDAISFPSHAKFTELLRDGFVWRAALTIAFVASAESLLCAAAVDRMHRGSRTRFDKELAAQGAGNALCGLLGALPLAGVIVRSSLNVQSGANSRLASVLHGVWLFGFALLLPGLLRLIPTATFAAILVYTAAKLMDVRSIRELWAESRVEGFICVATLIAVVVVDLLTGVLLGLGLSTLNLIYAFARLRIRYREDLQSGKAKLVLEGSATFLRLPKLAAVLDRIAPGTAVHVDCGALSYIDHSCLTLLTNWGTQHETAGGQVVVDWNLLRSRFRAARPRPRVEPDATRTRMDFKST